MDEICSLQDREKAMVDTLKEKIKTRAGLIHAYESLTNEGERLTFRAKFKGRWAIIGNSYQSPEEPVGRCFQCRGRVLKFSGWGLRLIDGQSNLYCKTCYGAFGVGFKFDRLSVFDAVLLLLQ